MSYGLLLLRVTTGLTLAAHGAQKLFGWWEGPGVQGAIGLTRSLGFRPAPLWAWQLILAEFLGGLGLALGLLTPAAALVIAIDMIIAVATVHGKNGFWSVKGGYEFNLLLLVSCITLAATGPGRFSLDRGIGWDDNISGLWWGVGVLAAAVAASALFLAVGRSRDPATTGQAA